MNNFMFVNQRLFKQQKNKEIKFSFLSIIITNYCFQQFATIEIPFIQNSLDVRINYYVYLKVLGFYLGIKLYKYLKFQKQLISFQIFKYVLFMNLFGVILQELTYYFVFSISRILLGIGYMMCLIETVFILKQLDDTPRKLILFLTIPLFQILGYWLTQIQLIGIQNSQSLSQMTAAIGFTYMIMLFFLILMIVLSFGMSCSVSEYNQLYYTKNYEKLMEDEQKDNSIFQQIQQHYKFLMMLIFPFQQVTQDFSYILNFKELSVVLFAILANICCYKIINIKKIVIFGQVVVILGLISTYFNVFNNSYFSIYKAIQIFGYFIGIGSTQYYIIQQELKFQQIIDYFESYSIFFMIYIYTGGSYISNYLSYYIQKTGIKIFIQLITLIILIIILKKSQKRETQEQKQIDQ